MTLAFLRTTNATISEVAINNSIEAGIIGINMFGVSNISKTMFSGNRPNCLIVFQEFYKLQQIPPTHFNIANTQVMFGKKPIHLLTYHNFGATGLGIFLAQTTFNVKIHIHNIKTYRNMKKEEWYGNLRFLIENWKCQCSVIRAKQIASANTEEKDTTQIYLKSKLLGSLPTCKCTKPVEEEYTLYISDSHFVGVGMQVGTNTNYCDTRIKLQNITVQNSILRVVKTTSIHAIHLSNMKFVEMQDINFIYNDGTGILIHHSNVTATGRCHLMYNTGHTSIISIFSSYISFHAHVKITENKVQGVAVILANNSTIKFQQTAELEQNQGRAGGAIALYNSSYLIVGNQSNVTFMRNNAQLYGGAISLDS